MAAKIKRIIGDDGTIHYYLGNGVRNNLSSIENYQNRNCKKGEEGTITQI